ncbi:RNA-binding protein hfq [Microcoleus sp. CAWBG58]|uniref:Hfq-related RNA-binding protein n=1 Tax=Microcoleus sp. CAWBG58 TaxID=2841651 RepID=UPI002600397C|nr:RNA-binding protein hfq [Microcoleus sp. CAWBG58]
MSEFETGLPSVRLIQSYIKDKEQLEIKLMTGDLLAGKIFWQDHSCICLLDASETQILISRSAIAYIKPNV